MFHIDSFEVIEVVPQLDLLDYGIQLLGADHYWTKTKGEGIGVAVLDTGVDLQHDDLKPNLKTTMDFSGEGFPDDKQGHGTHTAGIIAGCDNGRGIVGIAPRCNLHSLKVLSSEGTGGFQAILGALEWVLATHKENGIKVVSMSLGSSDSYPPVESVLVKIKEAGITAVCAAGNSGNTSRWQSDVSFPAKLAAKGLCISVGAVDVNKKLAKFSSTGKEGEVTVVGAGVDVLSCYPVNQYAKLSGTSMAAPTISALCALLLGHHPEIVGLDAVIQKLKSISSSLGDSWQFGIGLPDLSKDA